jgi:ATP synthase F1 delta subunit
MKQARKFARMFLGAADDAEKALEELAVLNALRDQSRDFTSILENPAFGREERSKAVEAVCSHLGFSAHSARFLNFLSDEGVASGLAVVLERAVAIYSESRNRVKATVLSPVALQEQAVERLRKALAGITGKDVELETEQDPALLGGILVKVGSRMFDASIKGQLRLLKEELIKG